MLLCCQAHHLRQLELQSYCCGELLQLCLVSNIIPSLIFTVSWGFCFQSTLEFLVTLKCELGIRLATDMCSIKPHQLQTCKMIIICMITELMQPLK